MSRRRAAVKREVLPDAKFGDAVLTKFMNCLMYEGKKSVAERIVYGAFDRIARSAAGRTRCACSTTRSTMSARRSRCARAASAAPPIRCRSRCAPTAARRWRSAG